MYKTVDFHTEMLNTLLKMENSGLLNSLSVAYNHIGDMIAGHYWDGSRFTQLIYTPSQGKALAEFTYDNLDIQFIFKQYGKELQINYLHKNKWVKCMYFNNKHHLTPRWIKPKNEITKTIQTHFQYGASIYCMFSQKKINHG